ncbi:hypothetical protein [Segatella copri]|uniref:hypothetical protein n=1 Tax=Segatella copri TaxID=165179 RepID=UPI00294B2252|nr:hypothetical protein [Segatella copri]WOG33013.1 hypothetical protein RJT04_05175 [Segatella copri]
MKRFLYYTFLLASVLAFSACSEEGEDMRPGLWNDGDVIETFPGDTVLVKGQVSNYVGMSSVSISCDAWNINKVYDLSKQKPKVFNYNYQLIVPADAEFDQELYICVSDKNGSENKRTVVLKYLPDTEAPTVAENMAGDVSVDFDTNTNKADWDLNLAVSDDRALKNYVIDVPDLNIHEEGELKGRTATISKHIEIAQVGSFPMTLTIEDECGNKMERSANLISMLAESEDAVADYPQMYMYNAEENASDYVYGYYRYMDRTDAYQYSCKIYAEKDGAKFYFVPTESQTGDKFGTSPYISSKLMNKNGYVVPVVVEKKGYYYVWLDLQNHRYSLTPYEVENTIWKGDLVVTGEGFSSMGDWSFSSAMKPAGSDYRKSIELGINSNSSSYSYCVTDGTAAWSQVWRMSDGKWWWLDNAGYGGSVATFKPGNAKKVLVTFDTAELWSTMKIVK